MNEKWWEQPARFVNDYWWAFLLIIILGLSAILFRDTWMPWLGMSPVVTPVVVTEMPVPTSTDTPASTPMATSTATVVTSTPVANSPAISRVNVSTDGDPFTGPGNAPITIIEFSDYQCPYCQSWQQEVYPQLMVNYGGKIRFVYRNLPLPMHPEAFPAAEAAECAGAQGAYWKYHDDLFSGKYGLSQDAYEKYATDLELDTVAFAACIKNHQFKSAVEADANYAARLGLNSTPSFYINGRLVIGAQPYESFKSIIDEELALKNNS